MTIKKSTALVNYELATGSFRSAMNNCKIYIFSGPVPDTADEALTVPGTHQILVTLTESGGGTALTWETTPVDGVLSMETTETRKGTVANSGTASFFRVCNGTDNGQGLAGVGDERFQGTIGTNMSYDMVLADTSLVATTDLTLDSLDFQNPKE